MAIKYQDLKPTDASFKLNGREFEMRPFDLAARVWAEDEFKTDEQPSGLLNLSQQVQDLRNLNPVYKCAWHLLKRKREFGSFERFLEAIEKSDEGESVVAGEIFKAFVKVLGVSEPMIEEMAEDVELKKP